MGRWLSIRLCLTIALGDHEALDLSRLKVKMLLKGLCHRGECTILEGNRSISSPCNGLSLILNIIDLLAAFRFNWQVLICVLFITLLLLFTICVFHLIQLVILAYGFLSVQCVTDVFGF